MELTTGLICDGEVGNIRAEMLDYSPEDNVFLPKKNSFNSLKLKPLPEEWMEVFTDGKIPYSFEPIETVTLGCEKTAKNAEFLTKKYLSNSRLSQLRSF